MKVGNEFARLLAALALGFVIAAGLFSLRSKGKREEGSLVYSEIAASLGKNVVALSRLNTNDIVGAKFILETSLDGGIMALHFRENEVILDESQRRVLTLAKEYRRNHPFFSTNYGVVRGDGVEDLMNKIIRR